MRVLQIGSDRSKRGILFPDSPATERQRAYAEKFGQLDIIGFSRRGEAQGFSEAHLAVYPTNSASRLVYGLDAMRLAKKLMRPDVVSSQDPFEAGLAASLIARRFGVPLHVQVHTDFLSREYARYSFINRIRVFIAGFVLKRAKRIRVVSGRVKKSIEEKYHLRAPITVLPIFVDVEKFKNASVDPQLAEKFSKFKTKLLVVARLEPEKNVALAIRAFAHSAPKDSCLIIVGSGSEKAALVREVREYGAEDHILFEGRRDAVSYYSLADLVLVPSTYEGYGLVIIEALASGKPVLSTDVGVAREAGAIVTSPERFAEALDEWFASGPRTGALAGSPYDSFDAYVRAYCDDIAACTKAK